MKLRSPDVVTYPPRTQQMLSTILDKKLSDSAKQSSVDWMMTHIGASKEAAQKALTR